MMADHNIGSLMVVDGDEVIGIVTERDCLQKIAESPDTFGSLEVSLITSRDIVFAELTDDLAYIMDAMIHKNCRHVPIMADGKLAGIISVRDVVREQLRETRSELKFLREYMSGPGA